MRLTATRRPPVATVAGHAPWCAPVVVVGIVYLMPDRVADVMVILVGIGVVGLVATHPQRAVMVMVTALPFDLYGTATLYRLGLPASVLKPLHLWPEAVLLGLALSAFAAFSRSERHLDALDLAALAYVGLGTAYLLDPGLFVGGALGAHLSFYARELGWHTDVEYIAALVLVRRIPFDAEQRAALARRVVCVGTILAALGLFEFADPSAWNHLSTSVLGVTNYQAQVLHALPTYASPTNIVSYGTLGGHRLVRVGSLLDYESLGFYLAVCLGLAAEMLFRGRSGRWGIPVLIVLALGLFVTQTRSAVLAGAVAIALAFRPGSGRIRAQRRRMLRALLVVAVAASVLFVVGHVGARLSGDQVSDGAHLSSIESGMRVLLANPTGRGLATAAGGGQTAVLRGQASGIIVTEDQWLQIGTQLGFAGLGLFALVCGLSVVRLGRRGKAVPSAVQNSLVGLLIGGTFLQPLITAPLSLTVFALVGAALPAGTKRAAADGPPKTGDLLPTVGAAHNE